MKYILGFFAVLAVILPLQARAADPSVGRAQFTTAILDREPVDAVTALDAGTSRILFFTELLGMDGKTVTHRWKHGADVIAEITFNVRGPRWRVHSSKELLPEWTGEFSVEVVDDTGTVYGTYTLTR